MSPEVARTARWHTRGPGSPWPAAGLERAAYRCARGQGTSWSRAPRTRVQVSLRRSLGEGDCERIRRDRLLSVRLIYVVMVRAFGWLARVCCVHPSKVA